MTLLWLRLYRYLNAMKLRLYSMRVSLNFETAIDRHSTKRFITIKTEASFGVVFDSVVGLYFYTNYKQPCAWRKRNQMFSRRYCRKHVENNIVGVKLEC